MTNGFRLTHQERTFANVKGFAVSSTGERLGLNFFTGEENKSQRIEGITPDEARDLLRKLEGALSLIGEPIRVHESPKK